MAFRTPTIVISALIAATVASLAMAQPVRRMTTPDGQAAPGANSTVNSSAQPKAGDQAPANAPRTSIFNLGRQSQPAGAPAQTPSVPTPVVAAGGASGPQINLYPITRFRGSPTVITESKDKVGPVSAESIFVTRGVWELCSEAYYFGKCQRVSETQMDIPVAIVVRSIRFVADTGPSYVQAPTSRAGPDIPMEHDTRVADLPVAATPVVAPTVEQGGRAGANPTLAGGGAETGRETKFFAAPAQNGLRVLACAQQPGANPNARCVQAAADGYCQAEGFQASNYREFEAVAGKAYLSNVICTRGGPPTAAAEKGGFRLPGLPFLK